MAAKRGIHIVEKTKMSGNRVVQKGREQNEEALSFQQTAVFKNKKYIGSLTEEETRGLLLVRGELVHDIIVLHCPQEHNGSISILVNASDSQFSPHFIKGQPIMDVTVKVDGEIQDIDCPDLQVTSNQINELNVALEDEIKHEIGTVLDKAQQQWQADIFGFGTALYHEDPKEWSKIAMQWREGGLSEMKVNITVRANISRTGLNKNPVKADESR